MAQAPEMVKQVSGIDLNQMLQNFTNEQTEQTPPAQPIQQIEESLDTPEIKPD